MTDSLGDQRLVKSTERVRDLGEVFTPAGTVEAMLDVANDVDGHESLGRVLEESPDLEWKVRKLSGVGPAAWRYILNLSRIEKVKPDTMIVRWVTGVVGAPVGQADAARWLEEAARSLKSKHPGLTVRQADHLVWRVQSKRPPTGDQ